MSAEIEQALTQLLGDAADQLEPRCRPEPARRLALWQRIEQDDGFADEHRHLPAAGGDWRVLREGVLLKLLQRDDASGQAHYLVRYSAGSGFPRHPQRTVEECLLVAGDLRIGDVEMRVGDLQVALPGTEHGPLLSRHGALVYVRGVLGQVPTQRADPPDPL